MNRVRLALVVFVVLATSPLFAGEIANGWRGNGTGLWPEAQVPLEWHRATHGATEGLRAQSSRPAGDEPGEAPLVRKGLVAEWLAIGPFPVPNSLEDLDKDPLGGEMDAIPEAGKEIAGKAWKVVTVPPDDPQVFGAAEMPRLNLAKALGYERSALAYAHVWLYSPRGGTARIIVDHFAGLKAWCNGKVVYREPKEKTNLGYYTGISGYEIRHMTPTSPRFDVTLNRGWNRLLLKLSSSHIEGYTEWQCTLRVSEPPGVEYEEKNIVWKSELPGRSTSTPILAGDRLFLMAEPDELLCLDRVTGRILWTAAVNPYEALTQEQKQAKPDYASKVDPLVAELNRETDRGKRLDLRKEIQKTLEEVDGSRFKLDLNDHFEAHFGIVGYTMPTPVCDGKRVYVWCGNGVAACFDLEGRRQWITRIDVGHLTYGSTPALVDGMFVVFLNKLYGLDAETGKLRWTQHKVHQNIASLLAGRLDGHDVVVTQRAEVIRPSDGELLFRSRGAGLTGDTGWCPGVILGDVLYQPVYGVAQVNTFDFRGRTESKWQPETVTFSLPPDINRAANGGWSDRWTAGSPLVFDGMWYAVDIYQRLYAVDLASQTLVYRKDLDLDGYTHYNSLAVAASPTLIGRHLFIVDNQGTTLILEPGREFKQVAKNHIGTQLERTWPLPAQETLTYSPPITDGKRIYLRGERYLYCIGTK